LRLAIIADTHMPRGSRRMPDECVRRLREADLILHLGDFSERSVLEELRALGPPVTAVRGNVDSTELRRLLPLEAEVEAAGVRLGLVHDAGPARGRLERLRERFPDADAVLFGHSHLPLHEAGDGGFQIFNPGSPTERRRAPTRSMGIADANEGTITFELLRLPEPSLP
jgi:putative phosphoesterase